MFTLSQIYRYVYEIESVFDSSGVPAQYRDQYKAKRKAEIIKAFEPLGPYYKQLFRYYLRKQKNYQLEELLYENTTDALEKQMVYGVTNYQMDEPLSEKNISEKFDIVNHQHPFFDKDDIEAKAAFIKYYKACELHIIYMGRNYRDHGYIVDLAFKMLVVFFHRESKKQNPFYFAEQYLKQSNAINKDNPLGEALSFALPKVNRDKPIDLAYWQDKVQGHGRAIHLFEYAYELTDEAKAGATLEDLNVKAASLRYTRYHENPELALLCWQHHVKEDEFNQCLEADKKHKQEDRMPNIKVELDSPNGKHHYVLTKLPSRDPLGYVLGHMTDCCQHICTSAGQCVIDGMQLSTSGFYVLLKGKKIFSSHVNPLFDKNYRVIAQAYAWLSQKNALVLDSWESLKHERDETMHDMLHQFGESIE